MSTSDHYGSESDSYDPEMDTNKNSITQSPTPTINALHFSEQDKQISLEHKNQTTTQKLQIPSTIRLFTDLPSETTAALSTFTQLQETTYQSRHIGEAETSSEFMSCQCVPEYEDAENELGNKACGDDDECINRGTKIECFHENRNYCGLNCQNQRFSRKEYATISIIKTELKGYGVRADTDMEPDLFVYEYIGEVIDEKVFKKRMIEYDQRGFKHFYFMMLQKGQFIDATEKGSLGRFCNHSCDPNCYVEKWVVGDKLKMGIFTKRQIKAGEELTFNYNVDRYGADSQPCYCGEPNCIGVIGGKTQTQATSLLPQVYSEALVSNFELDSELRFVKEMKENGIELEKNENGVNVEYVKSLIIRPIEIYQVPKVSAALLQCEDLLILDKLVLRMEKSKEEIIKKLYFTHGLESFKRLIKCYLRDSNDEWESLIIRLLVILNDGPSVSKNYLKKTEIQSTIQDLLEQTAQYSALYIKAEEVLERFATFEERHMIKKRTENTVIKPIFASFHSRNNNQSSGSTTPLSTNTPLELPQLEIMEQVPKTGRVLLQSRDNHGLPKHWQVYLDYDQGANYYFNTLSGKAQWEKPSARQLHEEVKLKLSAEISMIKAKEEEHRRQEEERAQLKRNEEKKKIQDIIAKAEAEEKLRIQTEEKERLQEERRQQRKKQQRSNTPQENHFRMWSHYFAKLITHIMKPYIDKLPQEIFKSQARELTRILTDKEYRRHPEILKIPQEGTKEAKVRYVKVKAFVVEYLEKVVQRLEQKKKIKEKKNPEGEDETVGDSKRHKKE